MKLTDWEDVNKIIDEGTDKKNKNKNIKLVNLEDVKNIINEWVEDYKLCPMKDRINSLPTYSQFTLDYCEKCLQMTNHIGDECQKCKVDPVQVLKEMIGIKIESQWVKLTAENRPESEVLILCDSGCQYVGYIHGFNHYEIYGYEKYDLVTYFQPLPSFPIMDEFISDEQKNNIVKYTSA